MALMKPTWQNKIKTLCCIKCVYCMVLFTVIEDAARKLRATVKTRGCWAGPKLLIGIILTSCNYSTEIRSCCTAFNKQAITQPTIIITRTIKSGSYSLVKCSHMWRPHILLGTLADKQGQRWTMSPANRENEGAGRGRHSRFSCTVRCYCIELYPSYIFAIISFWCSTFSICLSFFNVSL